MPVPVPRQRAIPAVESGQAQAAGAVGGPLKEEAHRDAAPTSGATLTLLLIEDDPVGSPIVPELLDSAGKPVRVRTARNLTEAERLLTDDVHCILLDLALPAPGGSDTDDELAVLHHVLQPADPVAAQGKHPVMLLHPQVPKLVFPQALPVARAGVLPAGEQKDTWRGHLLLF